MDRKSITVRDLDRVEGLTSEHPELADLGATAHQIIVGCRDIQRPNACGLAEHRVDAARCDLAAYAQRQRRSSIGARKRRKGDPKRTMQRICFPPPRWGLSAQL